MTQQIYQIERLVHGGFGLSRDPDGRVVLIEGVIGGEAVEAKVKDGTKKVKKGVVSRVVQPSPGRITPPCPHYSHCGGCDFQHMSYPFQLQAKKEILRDLLKRSGHPILREHGEAILADPLPSPIQFHYRQRIRLQVDERGVVGFHKRHSHQCVGVSRCLLATEAINDCLRKLLQHPALSGLLPHTAGVEILYDPCSTSNSLLIHYRRKPRPSDRQAGQRVVLDIDEISSLFFVGEDFAATGQGNLTYTLPSILPHTHTPLTLSLETGGFCQVNLAQNEQLVKTVLDYLQPGENDSVLDLFCGMGNFSVPLAEKVRSLMGVEGQGSAIRSAKKNSGAAGQENTTFIKSPIHQACESLFREQRAFDCILIDPPRQGAPGLAETLAALCRKRLVYVSCDPATLCRDLAQLLEEGFALIALQGVDMFPQTHHLETVALLEK